jgi:hypothetical protein
MIFGKSSDADVLKSDKSTKQRKHRTDKQNQTS